MGKQLKILMGQSASGKDTILKEFVKKGDIPLPSFTDRPIRKGEVDGVEYFFVSKDKFQELIDKEILIEYREYHTLVNGVKDTWRYGLPKRKLNPKEKYIVISDVNGTKSLIDYYGKEKCKVFYIYAPLKIRKERCMQRGDYDESEFLRRAENDLVDFSKEKRKTVNPVTIYNFNKSLDAVVKEIEVNFNV